MTSCRLRFLPALGPRPSAPRVRLACLLWPLGLSVPRRRRSPPPPSLRPRPPRPPPPPPSPLRLLRHRPPGRIARTRRPRRLDAGCRERPYAHVQGPRGHRQRPGGRGLRHGAGWARVFAITPDGLQGRSVVGRCRGLAPQDAAEAKIMPPAPRLTACRIVENTTAAVAVEATFAAAGREVTATYRLTMGQPILEVRPARPPAASPSRACATTPSCPTTSATTGSSNSPFSPHRGGACRPRTSSSASPPVAIP